MESIVVAFGGNAIAPAGGTGAPEEQRANVRAMSAALGRLVLDGYRVIVTHGNGPQVGEIMLRSDLARGTVVPHTLDVAGAMSQGQIGYMLQQEIGNFLTAAGRAATVCSVVTQVVVDRADPAFDTPTKPIGRFYDADTAREFRRSRGWNMVEDAGRGYRRVVPSPVPRTIVEWPAVKALTESGALVIAAGGGGVPVVVDADGSLRGVEAVIDKDLASQCLASLVGASTLVLVTEVEQVSIGYGTPEQRPLGVVSAEAMREYMAEGHFPRGSMGPKVAAALRFVETGGARTIITTAGRMVEAVQSGRVGTQIGRYAADAVGAPAGSRSERS